MPLVHQLVSSFVVFFCTVTVFIYLIRKPDLANDLSWLQKRSFWKCYDFIWYGSGLVALLAFWLALVEQSYRSELDDLSTSLESDASTVEGALRATSGFCETKSSLLGSNNNLLARCIWINGTLRLLQSQSANHLYPTAPIRQTIHSIDVLPGVSEDLVIGGLNDVTIDWDTIGIQLWINVQEFHKLADGSDERFLLPNPQGFPNGHLMDRRLKRIDKLRSDLIPGALPLNVQGALWLHIFAFLIGLKISKTYAELYLKE